MAAAAASLQPRGPASSVLFTFALATQQPDMLMCLVSGQLAMHQGGNNAGAIAATHADVLSFLAAAPRPA